MNLLFVSGIGKKCFYQSSRFAYSKRPIYWFCFISRRPTFWNRAHKLGLEGLIGKRSGSRYEAGKRSGAWIRINLHQEQEFVIGGYTEPEGARKNFGASLIGF